MSQKLSRYFESLVRKLESSSSQIKLNILNVSLLNTKIFTSKQTENVFQSVSNVFNTFKV